MPQHKSLKARRSAAQGLASELKKLDAPPGVPLVVDTMSNAASLAYGALPERLVILQGGLVKFIGGKGPEEYSIQEGRQALSALVAV